MLLATTTVAIILDPRFKDLRLFTVPELRELARSELRDALLAMVRAGDRQPAGEGAADAESDSEPAAAGADAAAPASKRPRTSGNWLDEMDEEEFEENEAAAAAAAGGQDVPSPLAELDVYLQQPLAAVKGFDVLKYWQSKSQPVLDADNNVVSAAEFPTLSLLARQFLAVDATSCQPERNFSTLGHVVSDLRSSTASWKVDMLLFLRMNRHMIPEVAALQQAQQQRKSQAAANARAAAAVQAAVAGSCA
jgi:hypothetical protein